MQAIGHFGLGCCFESVNIYDHQREILSLSKLLKRLRNFPSGMWNEVYFNPCKILDLKSILKLNNVDQKFKLIRFNYLNDSGDLHVHKKVTYKTKIHLVVE